MTNYIATVTPATWIMLEVHAGREIMTVAGHCSRLGL